MEKMAHSLRFGNNAYGGSTPANAPFTMEIRWQAPDGLKVRWNLPGDRRFLFNRSTFTPSPRSEWDYVGMPRRKVRQRRQYESVKLLYSADDKGFRRFQNCFKLFDGPEASNLPCRNLITNPLFTWLMKKVNLTTIKVLRITDYAELTFLSRRPNSPIAAFKHPDSPVQIWRLHRLSGLSATCQAIFQTDLRPIQSNSIFQCDVKNGLLKTD